MDVPQSNASFGDFYRDHSRAVYRFALGLSGNAAEAEDLTAEALGSWRPCAVGLRARGPAMGFVLLAIAAFFWWRYLREVSAMRGTGLGPTRNQWVAAG